MSGFDRIKPPEQRIAQRQLSREDGDAADEARPDRPGAEGRAALFSTSDGGATAPEDPRARRATPPAGDSTAPPQPPVTPPPAGRAAAGTRSGSRRGPDGAASTPPDAGEGAADPRAARMPGGSSVLHVECQHCGLSGPMPLGAAVRKVLPLALVNPLRSHPVFAICPCGERRAWLKPTLGPPR